MIKSKLSKEKLLGEEATWEIQSACRQTVKDLKVLLSGLEKFQTNEFQVDQKKRKTAFYIFLFVNINIFRSLYLHAVVTIFYFKNYIDFICLLLFPNFILT